MRGNVLLFCSSTGQCIFDHLTPKDMRKSILTLSFVFVALALTAQESQVAVRDTPQMTAKAAERTALVHKTVTLTDEQTAQVTEAYLQVERYHQAIEQRFEGQPAEVKEADMPAQYANMDDHVEKRLAVILTPEQLAKWHEANK